MQPFKITVPEAELADLKARLAAARFPDELEGVGWDYGTSVAWLRPFPRRSTTRRSQRPAMP